jgi:RNA polymerase sigma factor (sigma-70 family)
MWTHLLSPPMRPPWPDDRPPTPSGAVTGPDWSTPLGVTVELLSRYKAGDRDALEALFARCVPPLRRWARGRLPDYARGMLETVDIVQDSVMQAFRRLEQFEPRHDGALQAYLREAVNNRIRDEIRRATRHPTSESLDEGQADDSASPLERAIGRQGVERYEAALARLRPVEREAVVARIELQQSYEEVAAALGKPTANAARVAVTRALKRLVEEMRGAP